MRLYLLLCPVFCLLFSTLFAQSLVFSELSLLGTDLTVVAKGETSLLEWGKEELVAHEGVYVERSGGDAFTQIGFLPVGSESFSFVDATPLPGQNFYRLRWVGVDGNSSFTPTVGLAFIEELWIYPVPARAFFTIEAVSGHHFRVLGPNGRLIREGKLTGARTQVPCEGWKSGVFSVEVLDASNAVIGRGKVVR